MEIVDEAILAVGLRLILLVVGADRRATPRLALPTPLIPRTPLTPLGIQRGAPP